MSPQPTAKLPHWPHALNVQSNAWQHAMPIPTFFQTVGFSQEMDMPETHDDKVITGHEPLLLGSSSEILAWRSRHVHLARPNEAELGATQKVVQFQVAMTAFCLCSKLAPLSISASHGTTPQISLSMCSESLAELALQS